MAGSRPATAEFHVPDEIEDITIAWRELLEAANAGDIQAALFLQKFDPWAREQLERCERFWRREEPSRDGLSSRT